MKKSSLPADLLWGIHPVLELLKSRPEQVKNLTVQRSKKGQKIDEILALAEQHDIQVNFTEAIQGLERFGDSNHQGIIARIAPPQKIQLEELLSAAKASSPQPLFIALDSIQDPHNLGAIIRSAAAAGVDGIILPKDRSAPLSGTVAKTSAGSIALVKICTVTNLATSLKHLKKEGFWIYGAAGEAERSLYELNFSGPVCLVLGSEGKGIRPLVREQCDFLISIPMHGPLNSLNASVAAGIMLFEVVRQRQKGRPST
jgi:23S rRNA (guanosine2251-2'-O)-methyltransferase